MSNHEDNLNILPEHMQGAMIRWIENGIEPGSFLDAVLRNDLRGACECADTMNRHRLYDYVVYLTNYAPRGCWGSLENVREWEKAGGLFGLKENGNVEAE